MYIDLNVLKTWRSTVGGMQTIPSHFSFQISLILLAEDDYTATLSACTDHVHTEEEIPSK